MGQRPTDQQCGSVKTMALQYSIGIGKQMASGPPDFTYNVNAKYFNCNGPTCPYTVIRFYDRVLPSPSPTITTPMPSLQPTRRPTLSPSTPCIKNDTHYVDSLHTTYLCIDMSDYFYMVTCDNSTNKLIMIEYYDNLCANESDRGSIHEGCDNWEIKYIEVVECTTPWNQSFIMNTTNTPMPPPQTTTTSKTITSTTAAKTSSSSSSSTTVVFAYK
ncbi:hypothetical protein RFI_15379 [Reticulomyxa filosa]|uniref:Uncharacterized protein n=1 Tax=Reticulomyxa filosa TaxID=46433 RepID=X6N7D4_RETFI|nr:hypothetical protein RFI_15379 [Reticulomyxa filosa]|eukprot:ETO21823.1 hypothetical protein RFI_15379 [Reticulomyxa filosa]